MSKYLEFNTPAIKEKSELASDFRLKNQGLTHLDRVYWNLPDEALYEEIVFRNEGKITKSGPILVNTGKHTARAAADKFVVQEESTKDNIWWGVQNRPFSSEKFNQLMGRVQSFCQGEELFVQDCYAGADPEYRLKVRIITEKAWHSLFARNMFITTDNKEELKQFIPDFTVIGLPGFKANPSIDSTRSETGIILNFAERTAIIANSLYGGEIKKSIFTVLNFLLTFEDVLPMHCSANVGKDGDAALFFGLSGTGKTTLGIQYIMISHINSQIEAADKTIKVTIHDNEELGFPVSKTKAEANATLKTEVAITARTGCLRNPLNCVLNPACMAKSAPPENARK